jgi:deoxyribonuclease-4
MEQATAECPVLLETPSGQGTETLVGQDEFIAFFQQFDDPRLRICVDTCHVFAAGIDPLTYIKAVEQVNPHLLQLIHLNDSKAPCGSCVDRHEAIGQGHIGMEKMREIIVYGESKRYPMVYEG